MIHYTGEFDQSGSIDLAATFSIPVRVYFEDTDSGGIVYYANYLKFMERARTEYLRQLGFEQDCLATRNKRQFVVKTVTVNYVKPARFNAMLNVTVQVSTLKRASMSFAQTITHDDDLICEGTVRLACLHTDSYKPASIPASIIEAIARER